MLDFPSNPSLGDIYQYWTWDGEKWVTGASTGNFLPIIGGIISGNLGVQGSTTLASLLVQGNSTLQGNATVHGTLSAVNDAVVGGNVLVNGNQRTLGDAEIVGDLELTGDADFGRNLTVAMDADIGGDLDVAGSATIAQNLAVGGDADITGTLNALGNVDVTGILTLTSDPTADLQAATKRYVDEAIAAQMLWQGTWDADANVPDLTDTAVQVNGYTWAITTPDPTQPFTIPATPVIPGLSGATVYNGDHVIWSDVANEFQITHGSSLSLQEAQDMFVELAGDTMTGSLTISGANNLSVGQDATITRDIAIGRDSNITRNLNVAADANLATASGNVAIGRPAGAGNLRVYGNVDVDQNFSVGSQPWLQVNGTVFNVSISGSAFFGPNFATYFNGPLYAQGGLYCQQFADLNGSFMQFQGGNVFLADSSTFNIGNNVVFSARGVRLGVGNIGSPYPQNLLISNMGDVIFHCGSQFAFYGYSPYFAGGAFFNVYNYGANPPTPSTSWAPGVWLGSNVSVQPVGGVGSGDTQMQVSSYGSHPTMDVNGGGGPGIRLSTWSSSGSAIWITQGNAFKPGGGAWGTTSDARTKTDVHDYSHGLKEICQLQPMTYRYNGRYRIPETGEVYVGLAAEQVESVMPEMVRKVRGKLDYDDDETDVLHLDTTALTYATINALKEITQRLEALEAKLK